MNEMFADFDLLTYGSKQVKKKIESIASLFEKVKQENGNICLSFSGGKDSTAALLLCLKFDIRPTIVWFNSGYEFPETASYVAYFVDKYDLPYREIKPTIDPLQKKIAVGFFDADAISKANKEILSVWHSTNKEYDCVITGMREEESQVRKITILKNGVYFFNKTYGANAFYPVAKFTAKEIFATIAGLEEIPHPIYQKAQTLDERDWIRVNWYILSRAHKGFYVFLRQHYPEQFRILTTQLPEIRTYV